MSFLFEESIDHLLQLINIHFNASSAAKNKLGLKYSINLNQHAKQVDSPTVSKFAKKHLCRIFYFFAESVNSLITVLWNYANVLLLV